MKSLNYNTGTCTVGLNEVAVNASGSARQKISIEPDPVKGYYVKGNIHNTYLLSKREVYIYLCAILNYCKSYKANYVLHDLYHIDYKGDLIEVELIEVCDDYYRFQDNSLQTYAIPFNQSYLIRK